MKVPFVTICKIVELVIMNNLKKSWLICTQLKKVKLILLSSVEVFNINSNCSLKCQIVETIVMACKEWKFEIFSFHMILLFNLTC